MAVGANLTEPVKLCPRFRVTGSAGPEYKNCAAETEALVIVIARKLELVTVTDFGALIVPTDCVPKVTDDVLEIPRA